MQIKVAYNAEVPETQVANLIKAHLVFKGDGFTDTDLALDTAFDAVSEIKDPEEHTSALPMPYGCDVLSVGKGERLDMEMDFIGEHLEEKPWVYVQSVIRYGEVMSNDCPERVMKLTDRSLEFIEGD